MGEAQEAHAVGSCRSPVHTLAASFAPGEFQGPKGSMERSAQAAAKSSSPMPGTEAAGLAKKSKSWDEGVLQVSMVYHGLSWFVLVYHGL